MCAKAWAILVARGGVFGGWKKETRQKHKILVEGTVAGLRSHLTRNSTKIVWLMVSSFGFQFGPSWPSTRARAPNDRPQVPTNSAMTPRICKVTLRWSLLGGSYRNGRHFRKREETKTRHGKQHKTQIRIEIGWFTGLQETSQASPRGSKVAPL